MIRIVAGELRGRRLHVVQGGGVRPTPERVREALFDILAGEVRDARLLDAYAGSGALGFEALSRGARHVVFVESSRTVCRRIEENVEQLGLGSRCQICCGATVERIRSGRLDGPFDLILADPPYAATGEAREFLEVAGAARLLTGPGLLVLERATRAGPPPVQGLAWELLRSARYGDSSLHFLRRPAR